MSQSQSLFALIWSVADLPRGDYKLSEFDCIVVPFRRRWMLETGRHTSA